MLDLCQIRRSTWLPAGIIHLRYSKRSHRNCTLHDANEHISLYCMKILPNKILTTLIFIAWYFFSRLCTCIRSYLQSKTSVFHTTPFKHIYNLLFLLVVIVVNRILVYSQGKRIVYSKFVFLCTAYTYAWSVTHKWLNWFHECPSFSLEWICWKEDFCSLQSEAVEFWADFFWHEFIFNSATHKSWHIHSLILMRTSYAIKPRSI